MEKFATMELSDRLQEQADAILAGKTPFPAADIFAAIDSWQILPQPATACLDLTQEEYYTTLSDHLLTLQGGLALMRDVTDRVLVNHVDGPAQEGELTFTYNHEAPYSSGYNRRLDLNVVTYGLKVIGAALAVTDRATLQAHLGRDAVMSLVLATTACAKG